MKLTQAQQKLWDDLIDLISHCGHTPTTIECNPDEWRTAKSLEKKGLIKVGDRSTNGFFEVEVIKQEEKKTR